MEFNFRGFKNAALSRSCKHDYQVKNYDLLYVQVLKDVFLSGFIIR